MHRTVAVAIALVVLVNAAPAIADVDTARKRFAEGVSLFQKGDYEGARRLFEDADREHHSPVIDYNLALTEERLGHLQAAVEGYERYLSEAGDSGEFTQPAAIAVAQIKARAGRLSIRTEPSNARVFINGWPIRERTPTTVYVPPGHHLVVVESERLRASADVEVEAAATREVVLIRPPDADPESPPHLRARNPVDLDGVIFGAAFQVVPYGFFARNQPNEEGATGIFVGAMAELGYAFTRRAVIGIRANGSVGSECKGVFDSHIASVGPTLSVRLYESLWVGAGLYGGNGETCRSTSLGKKTFSTDIVFSPVFDISYAVTTQRYGQWLLSAGIGYYFATPSNDNRLIYAPIGFGPRWF